MDSCSARAGGCRLFSLALIVLRESKAERRPKDGHWHGGNRILSSWWFFIFSFPRLDVNVGLSGCGRLRRWLRYNKQRERRKNILKQPWSLRSSPKMEPGSRALALVLLRYSLVQGFDFLGSLAGLQREFSELAWIREEVFPANLTSGQAKTNTKTLASARLPCITIVIIVWHFTVFMASFPGDTFWHSLPLRLTSPDTHSRRQDSRIACPRQKKDGKANWLEKIAFILIFAGT